jgi:transposase
MPRAAAPSLPLAEREREKLLQVSKLRSTPQSVSLRVQIALRAAEGIANKVLARQLSTTLPTVLLWRRRYQNEGLAGILEDRPRSGRPREISAEQEAALVETTLHRTPQDATHWSVRSMAKTQGVSAASVQRIWKKHHLQPLSGGTIQIQHRPAVRGESP